MRPTFPTTTQAFYHHAATSPDAVAVRDLSRGQSELTYAELAKRSQAVAHALRQAGVQPGQRVPLVVKRGMEMVVGIWGVLSCGAQYVPLDGGVVPDSSLRHVVDQAGGAIVLCMGSTEQRVRNLFPNVNTVRIEDHWLSATASGRNDFVDLATPESGCYVIYTSGKTFCDRICNNLVLTDSGTTGKPKGVDVTHKNVANLVCLSPGGLEISPGSRVGQVLNISFDMGEYRNPQRLSAALTGDRSCMGGVFLLLQRWHSCRPRLRLGGRSQTGN